MCNLYTESVSFFKKALFFFLCLGSLHTSTGKTDLNGFSIKIGTNFTLTDKIVLKKSLDEISGMVYDDKNNTIVAINDEKGEIYSVDLKNTGSYWSSKFEEGGDYEDIAKVGNSYYVLRSDGALFEVAGIATETVASKKHKFPAEKNEFEGLYYDPVNNQLRLLCKSCEGDKSSKEVSLYAFDLKTRKFLSTPVMYIDVKAISAKAGADKLHFKPSAIAIHPVEKKLYILSSVNKLMVKCDLSGKVEDVWVLDPLLFKQPEGIAFSSKGDMYISNEAAGGSGEILFFTYSRQ